MKKVYVLLIIFMFVGIGLYIQFFTSTNLTQLPEEIGTQILNAVAQTRGYKNNNFGNIRPDGQLWKGEIQPSTDKDFKQFVDPKSGYREIFVNLRGYLKRGINTISNIINTWAPPTENDTIGYINDVVRQTGVPANQTVTISDANVMKALASAISRHENGVPAIPSQVNSGWDYFLQG